jgi:hypothetical protein
MITVPMDTKLRITVSAYKDDDMPKDFKPEGYYVMSEYVIGDNYDDLFGQVSERVPEMAHDIIQAVKRARNSGTK